MQWQSGKEVWNNSYKSFTTTKCTDCQDQDFWLSSAWSASSSSVVWIHIVKQQYIYPDFDGRTLAGPKLFNICWLSITGPGAAWNALWLLLSPPVFSLGFCISVGSLDFWFIYHERLASCNLSDIQQDEEECWRSIVQCPVEEAELLNVHQRHQGSL